jgi:hypothetical protein
MKRRGIVLLYLPIKMEGSGKIRYLRKRFFSLPSQYGSVSQIISPDPALVREAIKPF